MDRLNTQADISQDTLNELQELEPSPIESPLELQDKQLPSPPAPVPSSRGFTFGLSGSSGHGTVYYLTRLQRYSSYVFTVYTTLHLTNTAILPLLTNSVPASETYLLLTRPYYQSPLLEPLLITLPLLSHIASGFLLRLHRRNTTLVRYGGADVRASARLAHRTHVWPPLSWGALSGYALVPLVAGHAFVNRVLPWWVEGGSSGVGLGFVSHGFAKHPGFAAVGYAVLVVVASGHVVWGWAKWLGLMPVGQKGEKERRRWWIINGLVGLLAGVWIAGGIGVVGRGGRAIGWVGKGYDELYAKVPLFSL